MKKRSSLNSSVLVAILGGGAGTRLFPLTKDRAKPAVPIGGEFRLMDIPISNCIHSGLRRIYVLTQFNSASLHRHISQSYRFDSFSGGFVEIMAAQQTPADSDWYQGTADAIRKNLVHLKDHDFERLLILSGDQLYRMDFAELIEQHLQTRAQVTVAAIPIRRPEVAACGIFRLDEHSRINGFVEKPRESAAQDPLRLDPGHQERLGIEGGGEFFLASMGIYLFEREALFQLLDNALMDFGKHVIPHAIATTQVHPYVFQGYWEDVGTIRSFFEANLHLASLEPSFDFFDPQAPIFSRWRALPPTKLNDVHARSSMVADGCIVDRCRLTEAVVGVRSFIGEGSDIQRSLILGSDSYESSESLRENSRSGRPRMGIGRDVRIQNAIIDKNARIGDRVVITPEGKPDTVDHELYYIRDGIVIIPKNQVIPSGTTI